MSCAACLVLFCKIFCSPITSFFTTTINTSQYGYHRYTARPTTPRTGCPLKHVPVLHSSRGNVPEVAFAGSATNREQHSLRQMPKAGRHTLAKTTSCVSIINWANVKGGVIANFHTMTKQINLQQPPLPLLLILLHHHHLLQHQLQRHPQSQKAWQQLHLLLPPN